MQGSHRVVLILALVAPILTATSSAETPKGDIYFRLSTSSAYEGKPRTRLEVYYEIPYEQLNFLRCDTLYKATVDFSAVFYDSTGEQAGGDIWRREILANTYEETKAATKRYASFVEFRILPGQYRMEARVEDLSSRRSGTIERGVTVRAFGEQDLELSDPIFLHFISDTLRFPNPSREYVQGSRGAVTFSIYRRSVTDTVSLETSLVDSEGKVWTSGPISLNDTKEQTKTVVFTTDTLPQDTFSFVVSSAGSMLGNWEFMVYQPFFFDFEKYSKRVESMRYVATGSELKRLKEAAPEEREEVYTEFWKKRDPVPSTEKNEAELGYFSRVEYANKHFGGLVEGWKTDRGRIYIQYGRPDEVEKHPFEIDRPPYEIWYYYSTGYTFLFVDEHNLGRYELLWWEGR